MQDQSSLPIPAPEIWRPIAGFEGRYEVSDQGRVRSLRRPVARRTVARPEPLVLQARPNHHGYPSLQLAGRTLCVHRLVLETFVGPRPPGMECGHLNGRSDDNRLENLRWVSHAENESHKLEHGTLQTGDRSWSRRHPERLARGARHRAYLHPESRPRGEGHGAARLTEADVRGIRAAAAAGTGQRDLARRFGVHQSTIWDVIRRKTWTHLDRAPAPPEAT